MYYEILKNWKDFRMISAQIIKIFTDLFKTI